MTDPLLIVLLRRIVNIGPVTTTDLISVGKRLGRDATQVRESLRAAHLKGWIDHADTTDDETLKKRKGYVATPAGAMVPIQESP